MFFRLVVNTEKGQLIDTGNLWDDSLPGGRLGMYVFSQAQVVWEDMKYVANGKQVVRIHVMNLYLPFRGCARDWAKLAIVRHSGTVFGDALTTYNASFYLLKSGKSCCVPDKFTWNEV